MKIDFDANKCCGNGMCAALAPDYFELQRDGTLVVLKNEAPDQDVDVLEQAVLSCPVEALRLIP